MRVTFWNQACVKKQSYFRSSNCMRQDFPKVLWNQFKTMISSFQHEAICNFLGEIQFQRTRRFDAMDLPATIDRSGNASKAFVRHRAHVESVSQFADAPKRACKDLLWLRGGAALIRRIQWIFWRIRLYTAARMRRHQGRMCQWLMLGNFASGIIWNFSASMNRNLIALISARTKAFLTE